MNWSHIREILNNRSLPILQYMAPTYCEFTKHPALLSPIELIGILVLTVLSYLFILMGVSYYVKSDLSLQNVTDKCKCFFATDIDEDNDLFPLKL